MPPLPRQDEVADAITAAGLSIDASELHGAVCGWCAGGGDDGDGWLGRVMADGAIADPAPASAIGRLRDATLRQFEDRDFGLQLLLPPEDASLAARSGALFDWCRGFLGGFGLASGADARLSPESREALEDLARLAAATAQEDGDAADEEALAEIEEFVRVSALLLHGDCVLAARHRRGLN
ncbi:YecA family protein [Luteimonas pelagia]